MRFTQPLPLPISFCLLGEACKRVMPGCLREWGREGIRYVRKASWLRAGRARVA